MALTEHRPLSKKEIAAMMRHCLGTKEVAEKEEVRVASIRLPGGEIYCFLDGEEKKSEEATTIRQEVLEAFHSLNPEGQSAFLNTLKN